jgi:hypothetical protein
VGSEKERSLRFSRPRAIAALIVTSLAISGATVFVVRSRDDLHAAQAGLTRSQHRVIELDAIQHRAAVARSNALAALQRARDALHSDTAAREHLDATDRAEYVVLTAALETLQQHRAELASGTARAHRLDDCLVGASQVLNEAAVGDRVHLASTLPRVQQLCNEAAA